MIFFLIKKAFFDMWDNMITVFLLNLGFVLVAAGAVYLPYFLSANSTLVFLGIALGVIVFNLYTGTASFFARDISDYTRGGFSDFLTYLKETWKASVGMAVITIIEIIVVLIAMPFYLQLGGVLGMAAVSLIFWISIVWWLAAQYYYGVRARLDTSIRKILRKSFVLLFDNTGFTIFLGIGTIVTFAISAFTAFLLPGITSILIWHQDAIKLRLLKYDYLEQHPEIHRRQIPWDALLIDERDRVGQRSIRGMIFPWKE